LFFLSPHLPANKQMGPRALPTAITPALSGFSCALNGSLRKTYSAPSLMCTTQDNGGPPPPQRPFRIFPPDPLPLPPLTPLSEPLGKCFSIVFFSPPAFVPSGQQPSDCQSSERFGSSPCQERDAVLLSPTLAPGWPYKTVDAVTTSGSEICAPLPFVRPTHHLRHLKGAHIPQWPSLVLPQANSTCPRPGPVPRYRFHHHHRFVRHHCSPPWHNRCISLFSRTSPSKGNSGTVLPSSPHSSLLAFYAFRRPILIKV